MASKWLQSIFRAIIVGRESKISAQVTKTASTFLKVSKISKVFYYICNWQKNLVWTQQVFTMSTVDCMLCRIDRSHVFIAKSNFFPFWETGLGRWRTKWVMTFGRLERRESLGWGGRGEEERGKKGWRERKSCFGSFVWTRDVFALFWTNNWKLQKKKLAVKQKMFLQKKIQEHY